MDLNLMTYERTLYTLFDLLSDVGGLSGILVTIFSVIISIWNYNSLENLLVSNLFNIKNEESHHDDHPLKRSSTEEIKISRTPYCRETLLCLLPGRCTVCCPLRKERAMQKAREKLAHETNIVEIIQSWRYMESALKLLMSR